MNEPIWRKHLSTIIVATCATIVIIASFIKEAVGGNNVALAIGLIALITFISVFVHIHFFVTSNEKRLSDIATRYKEELHGSRMRVFSSPKSALEYFTSRVTEMIRIRNTCVCAMDQIPQVKNEYMEQPWYKDYISSVLDPLKNSRLTYRDILTPGIMKIREHRFFYSKTLILGLLTPQKS